MSTTIASTDPMGEGQPMPLLPSLRQPWYVAPAAILNRQALEDEHTRILAQAVGDHLPYELSLRAAAVAEQLQHCA